MLCLVIYPALKFPFGGTSGKSDGFATTSTSSPPKTILFQAQLKPQPEESMKTSKNPFTGFMGSKNNEPKSSDAMRGGYREPEKTPPLVQQKAPAMKLESKFDSIYDS